MISHKNIKTIEDHNFKGKKVLIRVDFNVPLNHNRQVTDDTRIRESLSTIKKILNDGASVILISHLGRPKGGFENDYSLTPLVPVLTELLGKNIIFTRDLFGQKTIDVCSKLNPGDVVLLENIRFYPEEEAGTDGEFAKQLASLGDAYVNDAFATSHRAHMSVSVLPKYFPNDKYFGLLLANELMNLERILNDAKPPYTAIIGGAKVSNKIGIIKTLINKVDNIIIGGGMAFTFIKSLGGNIGGSLYEEDWVGAAKDMVKEMMLKGVNLYLPTDVVIADKFSNDANYKLCSADDIPDKWLGLDIGKKTCRRYAEIINNSSTLLWNGPMGVFEFPAFAEGTFGIAKAVAESSAVSIIGGGESVAAIQQSGLAEKITHISTGGGASLEMLEGLELPGVAALQDK